MSEKNRKKKGGGGYVLAQDTDRSRPCTREREDGRREREGGGGEGGD